MSAWYEKAVFYHVYPLGLCGCSKENDYKGTGDGFERLNRLIEHMKIMNFGGIYIGPLFESLTHGYDTTDYKKVDGRLGTNDDFKKWVQRCHENGIRVVVDGVFNHTVRDFPAFKNLREQQWESWGKDWYCQVDFNGQSSFGDPFSYESWRGFAQLPKLNMANPQVKDYLLDVVRFWVDTFDIDGIRLDCADVLDFDFMHRLRSLADEIKPEFWLMGEVIHGDYGRWVNKETLHSVTNYELHKGIFSAHNSHNYFEMAHSIRRLFDPNYGLCRDAHLYNFVDNHDVDRIYNKLENKKNLFPVYAFLYTIIGIPSVYYGSEFGISGCKADGGDDALRPAFDPWNFENPNPELTAWIQKLGAIHRQCPELWDGKYEELFLTNRQYAYARVGRSGTGGDFCGRQAVITILNNDTSAAEIDIRLPFHASSCMDLMDGSLVTLSDHAVHVTVEGNGARIMRIFQE